MTVTSTDYDQHVIDEARKLADLTTISDIAEYFMADRGADDISARNPLPAFFGRGTVTIRDLLAIIDRQSAEITSLRGELDAYAAVSNYRPAADEPLTHVPMACTACGTPVMEYAPGEWGHKTETAEANCTAHPVKARVDA